MHAIKEELETNRYVVNEKLPKEIESKMAVVADLNRVTDIAAIDKNDIVELQQKV
ncbi:unnamed protein product [Gongylonema pulchrum]|uniref:Uncharacterized protein n=1 Tax=Gongylonema pulchrum TaxID=637853 RepID=A0A3P7Q250_9BILA|nr:unnamed protein product [Gongylonema pulchrum]